MSNEGVTQSQDVDTPQGALLRQAAALSQFAQGFQQAVQNSGELSDELTDSSARSQAFGDQRRVTPTNQEQTPSYAFLPLSQARVDLLRGISSLERYQSTMHSAIAQLFAYLGYTEIMFAEHMCSGVPEALVASGVPQVGPTQTRDQLHAEAVADFDSATVHADAGDSVSTSVRYLAALGRARVLLAEDSAAAAAVVVGAVPATFVSQIASDASTQPNLLFTGFNTGFFSMSEREGGNGLDFVSAGQAGDPRIPVDVVSTPGAPTIFAFHAYDDGSAPVTLASGVEAQLIEAEAALQAGSVNQWMGILNALRQTAVTPAVTPLGVDSTTGATDSLRIDVQFRERAFWLYLTAHRQDDLRRLVRQYHRTIDEVFPTGSYDVPTGISYGGDVTFVPFGESGNPNYHGCIDRNP